MTRLSYKALFIIVFFLLISIVGLIRISQKPSSTQAAWFDDAYSYRQRVDIASASSLTNYQISLSIGTSALINSGKMLSSCNDIRITDTNGKLLPHWIEENNPGCNQPTDTKIWVKVPTIPASTSTLYVYYGNPNAPNIADGNKVFEFFDDFNSSVLNSSKWSQINSPNPNLSGGTMSISLTGDSTMRYLQSTSYTTSYGKAIRTRQRDNVNTTGYPGEFGFGIRSSAATNEVLKGVYTAYQFTLLIGNGTESYNSGTAGDANWHIWDLNWLSNQTKLARDASQIGATITTNIPSTTLPVTVGRPDYGPVGSTHRTDMDWIFVRSLVDAEPTISSPSTEEKSPAPIAYWKFDEGVGTTTYDSIGQNNGVVSGATWSTEDQCVSGKCLKFDGAANYVDFGNSSRLQIETGNFTVETWFKTTISKCGAEVIDKGKNILCGSPIYGGWSLGQNNGKTIFRISDSVTDNNASVTENVTRVNEWVHAVGIRNGDTISLYINGKFVGSQTQANINIDTDVTLRAGGHTTAAWNAQGFIDNVKIYPYVRTAAQIKSDYNAGKAHAASAKGVAVALGDNNKNGEFLSNGLIGYWKLDENTGTSFLDSSSNGYTGAFATGSSTPSWSSGKYGVGLSFNGSTSYAYTSTIAHTNTSGITGCAWVYPLSFPYAVNAAIRKQNSSGMSIRFDSTGKFNDRTVNSANTNSSAYTSTTALTTNTWSHVCVTWQSPGPNQPIVLRYYINGQKDLDVATDISDPNGYVEASTSFPLWIGNDPDLPTRVFNGKIDEVRYYNRTLSPSEISQLYNWTPSPVVNWNFDENKGIVTNDSSSYSNNGTLTSNPIWSTGKYGSSLKFNGSTSYVSGTNNSSVQLNTGTVEAWIRTPDAGSSYRGIVTKQLAYGMFLGDNTFGIYDWGTGTWRSSGRSLNDNQWHHVAFSFQSGVSNGSTIYIDGIGITNTTMTVSAQTVALVAGAGSNGASQVFTGNIDDVRVYNYARTPKQIIEDMNAGHPAGGSPAGSQVGYWKFDEGYGTIANNTGIGGSAIKGTFSSQQTLPTWINDGKFGKAVSFIGDPDGNGNLTGSYISIPTNSALHPTDQVTLTAWVKKPVGATGTIIRTSGDYFLGFTTATTLRFGVNSAWSDQNSGYPDDGQWHYLVGKYDGSYTYRYVDGKLLGKTARTGAITNSNLAVILGTRDDLFAEYYTGYIDEVKIYNYSLTDDEIKLDYNHGSSFQFGQTSQTIGSTTTSLDYCVPGDTAACSPPIAEWNFNEGTGTTAYDTSGSSYNCGLIGNTNYSNGKIGKSISVGTTATYASCGTSLNPVTPVTLESWVKLNSLTVNNSLLAKNGTWLWYIRNSGGTQLSMYGVGVSEIWAPYTFNQNSWYFLSSSIDNSGNVKHYVNGQLITNTQGGTTTLNSNANPFTIAKWSTNGWLDGQIDQVKVYNYVRTPAQIAYDYNRGAPATSFNFDECQGNILHDVSGVGQTGIITIGATGTQNSLGNCSIGISAAWTNGASGKYSSSLSFDGTDDKVTLGSLTVPTHMSISAWIKKTSSTGQKSFFSNRGGSGAIYLGLSASQIFLYDNNATPPGITSATGTISFGQWQHIVATSNGSTTTFYLNGQQVYQTAQSRSSSTGTSAGIGWDPAIGTEYWDGQIDDVKLFNYPLTATQVKSLYNNGSVNFSP